MNKNVIFIGFMGSGKSTIAKGLARALGAKFMDTDSEIKKRNGKGIKAIFAEFGEDFFRCQERNLASELKDLKGYVIATGGGFHKALQKSENSVIIYLKASFEFLRERLGEKGLKKRPLFADTQKARALYEARLAEYEKIANLIVNVEGKSPKELIDEIVKDLK